MYDNVYFQMACQMEIKKKFIFSFLFGTNYFLIIIFFGMPYLLANWHSIPACIGPIAVAQMPYAESWGWMDWYSDIGFGSILGHLRNGKCPLKQAVSKSF